MRFALRLSAAFVAIASLAAAQNAPIAPQEATRHMRLPEGFRATLFAGEPDVVQPIAMAFDDRGRLWVVECLSYPKWGSEPTDRVCIFEDADNDGRFDRKKIFCHGANLSGINLGFGGVWLCSLPNLIFVPDRNADDTPDGPPEVLLDGWSLECKHNVFNSLTWGPDGWLYGCNGILATSRVGKPGTPESERVPMNCGVWRYHPTQHHFEVVAHGTTNPFGLDFDQYGQMFFTNCVIKHLWHVVPGAHFQRMYGQDFNPHVYRLMESCADHIHWAGGPWQQARGGAEHSDFGGGHAHTGCMIYLGDNWPDDYRNRLFTCNIHGNRVNQDLLVPRGSGYVATHGDDFLHAGDPWFRGIALAYGPDGGVYVTDWCDTGECHDYEDIHRENGRIYKITYGEPKPLPRDLAKLSNHELVELQSHRNDWHARHARRLLQERFSGPGADNTARHEVAAMLDRKLRQADSEAVALRAVWSLYAIGALDEQRIDRLLASPREPLRAWGVRLEMDDKSVSASRLAQLAAMAKSDASAVVRLHLASGLQRLPLEHRWKIAAGLLSHLRDADDANLPLMSWYAIEPLAAAEPSRALALVPDAQIPIVRQFLARRVAADGKLEPLVELLAQLANRESQHDVLRGMLEALEGRRDVRMPAGWQGVAAKLSASKRPDVRESALELALVFGDEQAIANLRAAMLDSATEPESRQQAVRLLVQRKLPDLAGPLEKLVGDRAVRGAALRGLAAYESASAPETILKNYAHFTESEKADAINTLASRPAYAMALLDAIDKNQIPRADVSTFTVRQLLGMKNKQIDERLRQVWGAIRTTPGDKAAEIARYKKLLTPESLQQADRSQGRLVYQRTCAACHKLFDAGGQIGPEITGAQRANLDYLLENLLDPSALVGRDYQITIIQTTDGRVINGIITSENDQVVAVQTQTERVLVAKTEIDQREQSKLSLMPEGQLARLTDAQVRDLIAYVAGPRQVPLPVEASGQ
jgi:putative membrane-bound dehydrogenase-like protein